MIFTQEAPLPRKWFSGRSCILSNWSKLGVNFEEGGNRSTRRKPSKSSWDLLKLNPHTTFVVEVEGVIGVHYASLTTQVVQRRVLYVDGHPSRYQPRPTGLNPSTAEWALRALTDFTLFNARRFYLSMGNPLVGKGLTTSKTMSQLTP